MANVLFFVILLGILHGNCGVLSVKVEIENTEDVMYQILVRVDDLERRDHDLKTTIVKQQEQLNQQEVTLQQQQSRLNKQAALLTDQSELLKLYKVKQATQDNRIAELESELDKQRIHTELMVNPPQIAEPINRNDKTPTPDSPVNAVKIKNEMETTNISYQYPALKRSGEPLRSLKPKRLVFGGNEGPVAFQASLDRAYHKI